MINLTPTQADYDQLLTAMPIAAERLKVIILSRMNTEQELEIATLKNGSEVEAETPVKKPKE